MKHLISMAVVILSAAIIAFGQVYNTPPAGIIAEEPFSVANGQSSNFPPDLDWNLLGSIPVDIDCPTGLAFDGENFWVPNWSAGPVNQYIYKIDPSTGNTLSTIPSPSMWPGGMTWDGQYLWVVDYLDGMKIFKISPLTGAVILSFPINYSTYWAGVAWDGQYLYYGINHSTPAQCYIYKIDPATGVELGSIPVPTLDISGLTYYDGYFYYSDSQTDSLYKMSTTGQIVESSFSHVDGPSGVDIAFGDLWNVDQMSYRIYQFDLGEPLAIEVALTPINPPILIPAGGGSFEFNIEVTNNGIFPAIFDLWTMAILPNGHEYGPLILALDLMLPPSSSADRDKMQVVPANAPPGVYMFQVFVGEYPGNVIDSDEFPFTKLIGD